MKYSIKNVHISTISHGDTVNHHGEIKTVGKKDIRRDAFIGFVLFGDSYKLGLEPVKKLIIYRALP